MKLDDYVDLSDPIIRFVHLVADRLRQEALELLSRGE